MFDLTESLRDWRLSLGDSMREQDLDELEEHLCLELESLRAAGLSEEEAFIVARRRIGGNSALGREFAKVHAAPLWIRRAQWMLVGYLGINAASAAGEILASLAGWSTASLGLGFPGRVGAGVLVQVLALVTLTWLFIGFLRARLPEGRRFLLLALLLALSAPLLAAGSMVTTVAQARIMTVEAMGQVVLATGYSRVILVALLPLALFLGVFLLERKRRLA